MLRQIISASLLVFAFFISSSTHAASFPSIVDGRVQTTSFESSVRPTINVDDDAFVDLFEIDDIDNDGIRDYQFQVLTQAFYDQYSDEDLPKDMACPSTYIAASSLVGDTLNVSEAIEIKGLERLYRKTDDVYNCFYSYALSPYAISDINNDKAPELIFTLEEAVNEVGSVLAYGQLVKGSIIDLTSILDGESNGAGFTISNKFREVAAPVGDMNGDGFNDLGLLGTALKIINSAALEDISNLSPATLDGAPALLNIELDFFQPELLAQGDFNGDGYSDVIMQLYSDRTGAGPFIIYGAENMQKNIQTTEIDSELTPFSVCSTNCNVESVGDINADGFDDVVLYWFGENEAAENTHAILYGAEAGFPESVTTTNSTFIDFTDLSKNEFVSVFGPGGVAAVGDINDDGANDIFLESSGDIGVVILGREGTMPERINAAKLNGENGFLLVVPELRYAPIMILDGNDDGIDDIVMIESAGNVPNKILVAGRKTSDNPVGLAELSVATGFSDSFVTWSVPDDATSQDQLSLYVDDVLLDTIEADIGFYHITPASAPEVSDSSVLRLDYANSQNVQATSLELRLKNEFKGLRQLNAKVIDTNSVALTWDNEPANYLVWRNGKVIARVNTNSYTDTTVSENTEYRYHVTQDIDARFMDLRPQGVPAYNETSFVSFYYDCLQQYETDYRGDSYRKVFPASTDSLLVRVDEDQKSFATPYLEFDPECIKDEEFRAYYSGYEVYSSTAVELFWERSSHINGVVGYEVSLFGETIATLEGTSFFYDQLGDEEFYTFEVTAIAGNGTRSLPATYYVYMPEINVNAQPPQHPEAPALQAKVYSSTALELFWEKGVDVNGNALGYAVKKDGEVQVINDAQSYFDDSLAPATSYDFDVTAFTQDGLESPSTRITLTTFSDSGPIAATTMPVGGRGKVYSNNALELFWDRSKVGNITHYVVLRNEQVIGETDGISFYDSGLSPDTEYDYAISARDVDGNEVGIAALLTLKTNSP